MMMGGLLFFLAWLVQAVSASQAAPPIQCEFRAFDGADEVTGETRVRVYANGRKGGGVPADSSGRIALTPGLYDVQVTRERDGQVRAIRWVDHLLIVRYPDEGGRHLEVTNFKPQYGALELRAPAAEYEATAYAAGNRSRPVAGSRTGDGYLLLVVPAGRYDVRITPRSAGGTERWIADVDVPADRTRLKTIGPAKMPE
jgi:hypothetical protein